MEINQVSQTQMVNQIIHIGHGDLNIYRDVGLEAAKYEPELLAHLIAWNEKKGQVRDSKVALPIIALRGEYDEEYFQNAVAHLLIQSPRELLKACEYHKSLRVPVTDGGGKLLKYGVERFIREREKKRVWWDRTVLQHRKAMKALYAFYHIKPNKRAQAVLFDKKKIGVFKTVSQLKCMKPDEAAGAILNQKIPYLIAIGAMGGIKDKPEVVMALMEQMTGNELVTNTTMLERMGVFDNPYGYLKAAYDKAIERAEKDKRMSKTKANVAAKKTKGKASKKLQSLDKEKRSQMGGIEGDWLVLGDMSYSMHSSIEVAKFISAEIAEQVKGKVHLVFFNTSPRYYDVTGLTIDEIKGKTRSIRANGGTAIGCGLEMLMDKNEIVNGIVICSDGGDNTAPNFGHAYRRYITKMGIEPTVYHYHVPGDRNVLGCQKVQMTKFELGSKVDYYQIPNLIQTMRTSKYSLVEEIMDVPLLTINDVYKKGKKK